VSRRMRRAGATRNACLMLGLVAVFLTFGVPRWLAGDVGPVASHADVSFTRLCRDHGGTPSTSRASTTGPRGKRFCTVRYGQRVYLMDAITPDGFDADTARYQRQGCQEARREQQASRAAGQRRRAFIYHPRTGVCERRS
jgi:hypothetical protein